VIFKRRFSGLQIILGENSGAKWHSKFYNLLREEDYEGGAEMPARRDIQKRGLFELILSGTGLRLF